MSDQPAPFPDDFRSRLAEQGQDAYALVWVAESSEPASFEATEAPQVGKTGIARAGADHARIALQDVTHGRAETLRRWLQLDDGVRHLAICTSESGVLREHTPGELAAELLHDAAGDEARLTEQLAGWFHRRYAEAQQGLELGWSAAAAAWACHMRALAGYPPTSVLTASLERAGELDESTRDLVVTTGLMIAGLIDRLELPYRTRAELVEDWHTVESLAADVPVLAPVARRVYADRGYDFDKYRRLLWKHGVKPLIARRGAAHGSGLGKVRWVVERTFAWLHQFKRIRVRYERRADLHVGLLQLACSIICLRRLRASC